MATATPLQAGDTFPAFKLEANDGTFYSNDTFAGKYFVLYFYPRANTPGCTAQACAVEQAIADKSINLPIVGVSPDPVKKLVNFATKFELVFPLISDENKELAHACGVYGDKTFCGVTRPGVHRIAFLVDPTGTIVHTFTGFKAKEFANVVQKYLAEHPIA